MKACNFHATSHGSMLQAAGTASVNVLGQEGETERWDLAVHHSGWQGQQKGEAGSCAFVNFLHSCLPLALDSSPRECGAILILYAWVSDVQCWASYLVLGKNVFSEGINNEAVLLDLWFGDRRG